MIKTDFHMRGGFPIFKVEEKYWMLNDVGCTIDYTLKIVESIKQVQDGTLEAYDFGGDVTGVFVEKGKSTARVAYDQYDFGTNTYVEKELEIPIEDIYNLMKDWKEYIEKWENMTGKTSY